MITIKKSAGFPNITNITRKTQCLIYSLIFWGFGTLFGHQLLTIHKKYLYLLEWLNDAYMLLSRILIGWSLLSQECCKLIGWEWKKKRFTWPISSFMPVWICKTPILIDEVSNKSLSVHKAIQLVKRPTADGCKSPEQVQFSKCRNGHCLWEKMWEYVILEQ